MPQILPEKRFFDFQEALTENPYYSSAYHNLYAEQLFP
jgi:hypothetical protein